MLLRFRCILLSNDVLTSRRVQSMDTVDTASEAISRDSSGTPEAFELAMNLSSVCSVGTPASR